MSAIRRAISIRQPHVEAILRGEKRIEYRSRKTNIRERVYLYAALKPGFQEDWEDLGRLPGSLPTGFIVGSVEIADCIFDDVDGQYNYILESPKRLRKKLKPRNQPQPGFWAPQF